MSNARPSRAHTEQRNAFFVRARLRDRQRGRAAEAVERPRERNGLDGDESVDPFALGCHVLSPTFGRRVLRAGGLARPGGAAPRSDVMFYLRPSVGECSGLVDSLGAAEPRLARSSWQIED